MFKKYIKFEIFQEIKKQNKQKASKEIQNSSRKKLQVGRDVMPNHIVQCLFYFSPRPRKSPLPDTAAIASLEQCLAVFAEPRRVNSTFLFSLVF